MKRFTKLMVAIAIVAMAIPAFSAVENIKVGGDLTIYGINRHNFFPPGFDGNDNSEHFQTNVRVYVQAQLTDNVEAMVRLINERMWSPVGDIDEDYGQQISLDLANIKVCGLGIDGLDLTIGRQEIQFGEGQVVGSAYVPYDNYPTDGDTWIAAEDLGMQKAFDAIRLDYKGNGPVDATLFMAKIWESTMGWTNYDRNLYGLNVGFNVQDKARIEGYYVRLQRMADIERNVTTVGVRATADLAGIGLKGEYARQLGQWFGEYDNTGWALLLGGQYNFNAAVSGNIHANLNLYSGDDGSSSENTEWITYFPANTASRIGAINYALATGWNGNDGLQNARVINVGAALKPVEKISLGIDWFNVNQMEEYWSSDTCIGNEIDASVTYNYTEDLAFGLQYGVLLAGNALDGTSGPTIVDEDPWQLIASAKLAF